MTNVALVALDTLRKDAFDEHFAWLPGCRFENAWSTSHWTVPVHASLFTGRYPTEVGVHTGSHVLDCPEETLAERLSAAGYTTRAFSANPYVSPFFEFDRGFDRFTGSWRLQAFDPDLFDWNQFISEVDTRSVLRYPYAVWRCLREDCATVPSLSFGAKLKLRDIGVGPFTDDGATSASSWLRDRSFGTDEFLFVNLMEAHAPYDPPAEYRTGETPDLDRIGATYGLTTPTHEDGALRGAYDDCVRYLSARYREIFARLETAFDYVFTLADHGELFGEHGWWGHTYSVAPELVHVPLVVSGSDVADGTHREPVSVLDVHRTIAEICGLDPTGRGRDLRQRPAGGRFVAQYTGLRPSIYERIASHESGQAETFDEWLTGIALPTDYYGFETPAGFRERGSTDVDEPRVALDEMVDAIDVRETGHGDEDVPESVRSQLADLGYV